TADAHESMILLALAWEDSGAHEKALALYSKVMTQGDPESGLVKLARILASAHLARMRLSAKPEQQKVILQKGRKMALYRNDESVKLLLTHKHPKTDLELLWGDSETDLRRVSFLKPRWGIEGMILSKAPTSLTFKVVRGTPESMRTLSAEFLVILGEGTDKEKLIRQKLTFGKGVKNIILTLEKGVLTVKKGESK
ncbi:hypothetical protein KJ865_13730, partial [Myxococcota bacterium]|nr:hypothetical protein [Myxococcota bacterium]